MATPDLMMFSTGSVRILNKTGVSFTLISAIPPRTNHCLKSWSGVCTALWRGSDILAVGCDDEGPFTYIFLFLNKDITARTFLVDIQGQPVE